MTVTREPERLPAQRPGHYCYLCEPLVERCPGPNNLHAGPGGSESLYSSCAISETAIRAVTQCAYPPCRIGVSSSSARTSVRLTVLLVGMIAGRAAVRLSKPLLAASLRRPCTCGATRGPAAVRSPSPMDEARRPQPLPGRSAGMPEITKLASARCAGGVHVAAWSKRLGRIPPSACPSSPAVALDVLRRHSAWPAALKYVALTAPAHK